MMDEFFYLVAAEAIYKRMAQAMFAKGLSLSREEFLKSQYAMTVAVDGVIRIAMERIPHVITGVGAPRALLSVSGS